MNLPTIMFGFISALLLGSGFHLWKGGGLSRLLQYLFFSCLGFWIGQFVSVIFQWQFLTIGSLQYGIDLFMSLLFLFATYWLGKQTPSKKK